MPQRPRAHQLEDVSRRKIREAFEGPGWVVEDLHKDYGEDLFVRIFKEGRSTPLSFFVQAKASDKLVVKARQRHVLVRVKTEHLYHWSQFWEPVFITIYDAQNDKTYWESVHYYLDSLSGKLHPLKAQKTISVRIPRANKLDSDGIKRILNITQGRFRRHAREVGGSRVLLGLLKKKGVEVVEYTPEYEAVWVRNEDGGVTMYSYGKYAEFYRLVEQKVNKDMLTIITEQLDKHQAEDNKPSAKRRRRVAKELLEQNRIREELFDLDEVIKTLSGSIKRRSTGSGNRSG